MSPKTILAAAALSAMAAPALAAPPPQKPIPYAQFDAYMAASAKERASRDWWAQAPTPEQTTLQADAETGAAADASADIPDSSPTSPMTVNPSDTAPPDVIAEPDTPVPTIPPVK